MSWIDKIIPSGVRKTHGDKKAIIPEGLWRKCVKCEAVLYLPDLERNAEVCPKCDQEFRMTRREKSVHLASCKGKQDTDVVDLVDITIDDSPKKHPPSPNYKQMLLEKSREAETQDRARSRSRSPRGSKEGGRKKKGPPVLGTKFD